MLATLKAPARRPTLSTVRASADMPAEPLKRLLGNRHFQPVLVASRPVRVTSRRSVGGSILTHFGMGALVVVATLSTSARPTGMPGDTTLIFLPQLAAAQPAERPAPALKPRPPADNPPPKGFQTVAVVTEIPSELPPVNLEEPPLDAANFSGTGVEGGVADGVVGGTGEDLSATSPADGIYDEATADGRYTPARVVRQVAAVYPPALRGAHIEGSVTIRFVVDTLGRVEAASIQVLESSRATFDQPAIQAILATRFAAARFDGRSVRQLTNQRISFRLR